MKIKRVVVSRKPNSGYFTITKEDTNGRIYQTELATFKQAATWIWMGNDDKHFARQSIERMAENYGESTDSLAFLKEE